MNDNHWDKSPDPTEEFHTRWPESITFGDLLEDGFDWGRYNYAIPNVPSRERAWIRSRVNYKIEHFYYMWQLGTRLPGVFKLNITNCLNLEMEILGPLYLQTLGGFDITQAEKTTQTGETGGTTHTRAKVLNSEMPQTTIKDNFDYLANSEDSEVEATNTGTKTSATSTNAPKLDRMLEFQDRWQGLDRRAVESVRDCFSMYHNL